MVQMNLSSTKSYIKLVLLSLILLFIIYFIAGPVLADTIYVDDGGGGDFTSIQEAIDTANESDTISVSSGTYNEAILINKSITLNGEGNSNTVIISSGTNTVKIESSNVTISGFKIKNSNGSSFACIQLYHVTDCQINDVIVQYGGNTIYLIDSNNNNICNNNIKDGNIGIYLSNSSNNIISDNIIQNNDVNGIFLNYVSSANRIYKNDFSYNNQKNARDLNNESPNLWSYNNEGNYWDDYCDLGGYDYNNDGKGDTPYIIDVNSQDSYPLGDFCSSKPIAYIEYISPNPGVKGQTITFKGHVTTGGEIIDWLWTSSINGDFGSASEITTSSLSVGTHNIRFKVYDGTEWSDYDTETLVITDPSSEVNQPPEATIVTIDPISSTEGESIYFHGYGVDTDGTVTGYSWRSSKDGIISSSPTFTSSDISAGAHTIYFKVKDNDGDWSIEASRQITIMENQTAVATPIAVIECPVSGVINHSLRFDASKSYVPDDPDAVLSFSWDFGDGKYGTGEIITHSFQSSGNYTVTLRVQDNLHHSSSKTASLSITNVSTDTDPIDNSTDQNEDIEVTPGFGFAALICGISVFLFINIRRKR